MKHKILLSPFFVYAFSFTSILLLYQIGWSDFYPELHGFLMYFIICTVIISLIYALVQSKNLHIPTEKITFKRGFIKKSIVFLLIGYSLDFIYESTVPLLRTFSDASYSYDDFKGVPTLHAVLATFNMFFSIAMFLHYTSYKTKKNFFIFIASMLPYVLILNRGAFMIVFCAVIFIYLSKIKSINFKSVLKAISILAVILYLFGVIGNVRQKQTKTDNTYLLRVGGATDRFLESGVPAEFYWSYIYMISPMGNLQNLIDKKKDDFDTENFGFFVATELFPDFISKRISSALEYDKIVEKDLSSRYLVTISLNAPTTYFRPYFELGSGGMIIVFAVIMVSAFIYPKLIENSSPYYMISLASLNSIILLSMFNNMWYNAGTILLWPLIFNYFYTHKIKR
ncbi:oligosaccharide repeat unit polymerase [Chryseobacterium salipaludis]|uniref:O-antigen polymerase n=1 Tax=Chryseobacterium TaxID=59732 RepID=UPI001FF36D67|nr:MULTISPECIES: O-antigen polymerase [Chryseobacterium]MCJ8497155.1 oligosaccharide repeat unit polymerase [Chryseobacterium salipaludis]MCX3296637.1 O-antigen ligase [Planobacterium sp. JC490]